MARTGLDKAEVKRASALLVAEGRYPSADAVRVVLGNTGSKSTIHKYLKELANESGKTDLRKEKTANTLQNLVQELAAKLHEDADARIDVMQAEIATALQRAQMEIASLQQQVSILNFQLMHAEENTRRFEQMLDSQSKNALQKNIDKRSGFGIFGALTNFSRNSNNKLGWSAFANQFGSRFNTPFSTTSDDGFVTG